MKQVNRQFVGAHSLFRIPYFLIFFFSVQLLGGECPYNASWWVDGKTQPASWEILPSSVECSKGTVVLSKRTELGWFSNFAAAPFELDGNTYQSVEGFWQSLKFPEGADDERFGLAEWEHTRQEVSQMVAFEAKRAGSAASKVMQEFGINWVSHRGKKMRYRTVEKGDHFRLIVRAMRAKLAAHPYQKKLLIETHPLRLLPDHKEKPPIPPAWKYYDIWAQLRSELLKQKD